MRVLPIYIIQFLAIYIPLEDTLLLALQLPDSLYAAGMAFIELVILGLLAMVVYQRAITGRRLRWMGLELPLFLFVAGALIAVFLNKASWVPAFMNAHALLRYVTLCFLVSQLSLRPAEVDRLLRWIVLSALFQVGFSLVQIAVPPLDNLLRAWRASVNVDVGGVVKTVAAQKVGNATGTFFLAVSAGMFLCIAITVLVVHRTLTRRWNVHQVLLLILFIVGVFLTYKRSTLLIAVAAVALIPAILGGRKERIRLFLVCLLAGVIVFVFLVFDAKNRTFSEKYNARSLRTEGVHDVFGYVTEIMTSDYWSNRIQESRGRLIFGVGRALVREPQIFGYSPDEVTAKKRLVAKTPILFWLLHFTPLEDVYWVALLLYYGLWGLLLWLILMYRIFKFGKRLAGIGTASSDVVLGRTLQVVVLMAVLEAMAERIFEVRGFSFYLWMLTGLTIARLRSVRLPNTPSCRSEA